MSYVLDALKKADAERERGSVPGLYAQPVRGMAADASSARQLPGWAWALMGGGVVSVAVVAGLMLGRGANGDADARQASGQAPAQTPPARAATPAVAVAAATPPAPAEMARAAQPAVAPPVVSVTPAAAVPTAPTAAVSNTSAAIGPTAPVVPPVPGAVAAAAPATQMPPARTAAPPAALPSATKSPAATPHVTSTPHSTSHTANASGNDPEGRILSLQELPPDLRRALPTLNVGGSVYSEHAPSRFVIINGQIYHENDKLTPELTLEQIRLKLAVLRYKDVRFRIMF